MSAPAQIAKTPAEEALQRHFEAVASDLPARTGSSAARHAAMARFGELGLPHRRIEAWKYTDLRTALRDVARPAVGSAATVEPAALDAALGSFAALDTYRAVFVNGRLDEALPTRARRAGAWTRNRFWPSTRPSSPTASRSRPRAKPVSTSR
jgi:Fe-S cluster assembly protein SufD